MKLRSIGICNFGCIGSPGYTVEVDEIVVLIGKNNVGKSTILDAYEALAGTGSSLPITKFHDENVENPIELSATFCDLTQNDYDSLGGNKWAFDDPKYGTCIRVKWVWNAPDKPGEKYSWDPTAGGFVKGGMGGWDTLIASRVPVPLRVRPTDDAATTEGQVTEILTAAVKLAIKNDKGRAAKVLEELQKLNAQLAEEVGAELNETVDAISEKLGKVFAGYSVEFEPQVGKFEPEKQLGAGSRIRVRAPGANSLPLDQQGAGLRRTFLWTALGSLADLGRVKHGKKALARETQRVLLIEEPESFLHPPMIRAAREALYSLAELPEWQVVVCTHSPVFIDVAKPHTTIVRVARGTTQPSSIFATDRAGFSAPERARLKMIRSCQPTVNEFFFADHVWLVEGETEHAALRVLLDQYHSDEATNIAVVNCMGKGNLPMFAKILNQFGSPYTVIHDSDAPKVKRKEKWQTNGMWTMNERIIEAIYERTADLPPSVAVCHVPDFESVYFGVRRKENKPDSCLQELERDDFGNADDLELLRQMVPQLVRGDHPGRWTTIDELMSRVKDWARANPPDSSEAWDLD
jgi:putative ATP-dependent endonuclease of OLD family